MKLDVNSLRYLSKEEWRVLGSVELGQRNHEMVPKELIVTIANLKHAGAEVYISNLAKYKLLHKESRKYEGYRLTYLGYDFLAIHSLVKKGVINSVGRQIGVGKESDVFEVMNDEGEVLALKLHRLGRTSFRAVKSKRDYLQHRTSFSWLYLSRLAAMKEYAFMVALGEHGLPVPYAVAHNRHCVLMTMVDAVPLVQIRELGNPGEIYRQCMGMMARLAELGLVHCDFNEFNLLVSDDDELTLIDFPQMVSTSHANAQELFERDVECVLRFFKKKLGYIPEHDPDLPYVRPDFQTCALQAILASNAEGKGLDVELAASGFGQHHQEMLDQYVQESAENAHPSLHGSSDSDDCDAQSSTGSEGSANLNAEQQEASDQQQGDDMDQLAHLARLKLDDGRAMQHSAAVSASDNVQQDAGSQESDGRCLADAGPGNRQHSQGLDQDPKLAEHLPEDLPDHVAIRNREKGPSAAFVSDAGQDFDDAGSVVSHGVQVPSQEAVQQRVVDQQRSRMRRQVLARASRNAQKVGNKRERKQTASSVNW